MITWLGTRQGQKSAYLRSSFPNLDFADRCWHERASVVLRDTIHEVVFSALIHLVERGHVRHAVVDLPLWRVRRRGRVRTSLLPDQGRQDRSEPRFRATLGDLQRHSGGLDHSAILAWVAASHGRRAADRGGSDAARMVETASTQSHRYAWRVPAERLHSRAGPKAKSDRRLQGLDARLRLIRYCSTGSAGAGKLLIPRPFPPIRSAIGDLRFAAFQWLTDTCEAGAIARALQGPLLTWPD